MAEVKLTHEHAAGAISLRNGQALCHPCHSRKTARKDGGFGNPKEGWRSANVSGPPLARPRITRHQSSTGFPRFYLMRDFTMGKRGPAPKPASRLKRRNKMPEIKLTKHEHMPAVPRGFLKQTRDLWIIYWTSPSAMLVSPEHLPIVERLFESYDERERARRAVRKFGRVVKGSRGQPVEHPLLRYIKDREAEIRQLEDRLGLSPRASQALGGNAQIGPSLDELNARLEITAEDFKEDPRLEIEV